MNALEELPPLKHVIDKAGLRASKRFGQNFLMDLNLTRKIARAGGPFDDCDVLEIGPGPGGLTRALLLEGATKVHAIEIDERCLSILADIQHADDRLIIHSGDALHININSQRPVRVVANLPYNVGTLLLTNWLEHKAPGNPTLSYTLMFQKEVAERITARVGDSAYGRLAVLTQLTCSCRQLFDVPPEAFVPAPKVTSTLVRLEPLAEPGSDDLSMVSHITRLAFGQRRKMLRRSLSSLHPNLSEFLNKIGVREEDRAEQVQPEQFAQLAKLVRQNPR